MDAIKSNIFELLNGLKQYIIPVYQRLYSWGKEQCECLWNDIIQMQKSDRQSHFLGSIVCVAEKTAPAGVQKYMVIDGQQRLTTLTLILIALRDSIKPNTTINVDELNTSFLLNQYKNNDDRYKLLMTEEDKNILISLIDKKPVPNGTESRLLNAYYYFKNQISKGLISDDLLFQATGKLQIVVITLDRGQDNPQAIFESMNSTGKELSSSDLIRNYVLMGVDKDTQIRIYNTLWRPMEFLFGHQNQDENMNWFFRDYLTMKNNRIPKIDSVYEEFKKWRENNAYYYDNEVLCTDLYKYAKIYTDIIFSKHEDTEIASLYSQMNLLSMNVINPFLLSLVNDYNEGIINNKDDFIEIVRLCISYVLRRNICEIPTNSLNKTFAIFDKEIVKTDYKNSVKAIFIKKDSYKEFPNDKKFKNAFISKEIYKSRVRNYILDRLENYDNKSPIIIEKLTIEHIMPQNDNPVDEWKKMLGPKWESIHEKYLHTIGNLTLTGYNSEMSDKPFMEKMIMDGGFQETSVRLNKYIIKQTEWNEDKINERANLLFEKAIKIWPYPTLTNEEFAPYEEKKEEAIYSIDDYKLNLFVKMMFNQLDTRIMNLSPDIKKEYKKLYVAYKLDTNFTDIVFLGNKLKITLNMKFSDINDPKGICRDVSNVGKWGNGDCEIIFDNLGQIEDVMNLIKQSHDLQLL